MRIKKYFLPLVFIAIAVSLLPSCNLVVSLSDENLPPTLPVIPSETATPVPTSTLTFTPSATITPFPTFISIVATTPTPTQQWSACPGIVVTQTDTDKGEILHILRCEDGFEYDLGPLAKGVYAVGPNDNFFVYITISGFVYVSKIGETHMYNLYNLGREHEFTVFNKGVAPDFKISFVDGTFSYTLVLLEKNYDQKRVYELPTRFTH